MIISGTKFYELVTSLQCNGVLDRIRSCDKTLSRESHAATLNDFSRIVAPLTIYFKACNDETMAKLVGEKHRRLRSNNVKNLMALAPHESHLRIGTIIAADAYCAGSCPWALKVRTRYDSLSITGSHSEIGANVLQMLSRNSSNKLCVVISFWFIDIVAEVDLLALSIFSKFAGDEATYRDRVCVDGTEYTAKERATLNRVIQVTDLQTMVVPSGQWSVKQAR